LVVKDLNQYYGGSHILRNVSFEVPPGKVTALLGRNGVGKTTLLKTMKNRRGGDLSGGQQQQLAIGRALAMKPRVLILDEPTEGIQPSIIKDIERVIQVLAERGDMGILLVEQYYDFARELADNYVVLRRGEIVLNGAGADMDRDNVRNFLSV
jgi:urea transport system ATP-binding protein